MNPLIGRACVIVDNRDPDGDFTVEVTRTPGLVMDLCPASTWARVGEREAESTQDWMLLVLIDGGRLCCVSHRKVVMM